ncbi:MAG: exodeoxyribonuclease III [Candidatus Sericytochromatia bacterium]|nr:exodeoxyribonuclease III [Candidatus Tanganyikabacteria bacterium]
MLIATWNVNGIRACEKGGLLDWLGATRPDVLCMQEVRAEPEQVSDAVREPAGYAATWHPARKKGYSGVATWVRGKGKTSAGIGDARFDDEGRALFTRFPGFTLANVYVPNGSRDHSRVPFKLEFYQALHDWVAARHAAGEKVAICGDWNTAHTEIDLANPRSNEKTTGFLPEERAWIDKFLALGLVDVFRAAHPDERGHYTWWSQRFGVRAKNIGWRLDYFLVSEGLAPRVERATIESHVPGSDHCPVLLEIR